MEDLLKQFGSALVGAILLYVGIWTGYWMARNAQDKPMRSPNNPPKKPPRREPILEPGLDPYAEALRAPDKEQRVPTIPSERS